VKFGQVDSEITGWEFALMPAVHILTS